MMVRKRADLAVVTAAIAVGIFILDTVMELEIAVDVFYVAVVLLAVRFLDRTGVLLVAVGCVALAIVSHVATRHGPLSVTALVNLLIGIAAIASAAYLALKNQAAERALRGQLRLVIDTIPALAWSMAPNGSADFVNQRFRDYTGLSSEQAMGWGWLNAIHPEDGTAFEKSWRTALAAGTVWNAEARWRHHTDGEYRWFLIRCVPLRNASGQITKWYATNTDIEDRKREEMVLREHARLLDLTHDTIFVRDMSDAITYWNRGAEERYGWPKSEAVGKGSHQLLGTIFPEPLEEITAKLRRDGRWEGELVHTRRDGTQVTVASRWSLQQDQGGRPAAILETNNDVTERKRAENALRRSEAYLAEAQRISRTGSFGWNVASGEIFWSDETYRIFAYDKAITPTIERALDRIHPEDRTQVGQLLERVARSGSDWEIEHRLLMPDGSVRNVRAMARASKDSSGSLEYVGAVTDITAARRAEEALHKSQAELAHVSRMTTLGELTASIAHEVNQPIAAAVANASAGLRWLAADPPELEEVRGTLGRIVRDGNRASAVIDRVRAMAKKAPPQKDWLDINETIRDVIALAGSQLQRNGVSLQTRLAPGLPLVHADRVQLQQVILNLLVNSVEAMRETDGPRELTIGASSSNAHDVVVAVRDTGPGFDSEAFAHLFDAFYTTKPGGMGMGLAISRSIIEAHCGRLWAEANTPRGAVLQLTLPVDGNASDNTA